MQIAGRYGVWMVTVALAAVCAVYYYVDPNQCALAPKCVVKLATGLDCPGCGFQRALHAFLHGNFRKAIDFNPFLLVGIGTVCLWTISRLFIHKVSDGYAEQRLARLNKGIIYLYLFCYFSWFVLRNIHKSLV